MDQAKTFECSDDDFYVRGQDDDEIFQIAKMHLEKKHQEDMSDDQIRAKIKPVE